MLCSRDLVIAAIGCVMMQVVFSAEGKDNKGRRFIFGFLDNLPTPDILGISLSLEIFITTDHAYQVTVNITTPLFNPSFKRTLTVRRHAVVKFQFNNNIRGLGTSLSNKGIYIQSDYEVAVFAANKEYGSTDALIVFPVDTLGDAYYVVTWNQRSVFMIIATEDNTLVEIKPSKSGTSVVYNGNVYTFGVPLAINMNRYQTFHVLGGLNSDYSGTHIASTKNVAVLSGSQCSKIGSGLCDHLCSQMTPVDTYGNMFVTVDMPNCRTAVSFKAVASEPNTIINIPGRSPETLVASGDHLTFSISAKPSMISTDKPIALAFFSHGGCGSDNGDPAMLLLPPIQQYAADYTFSTVEFPSDPFVSSLALVIEQSNIDGLLLDGRNMSSRQWRSVDGNSNLSITDFFVAEGSHTIYHINPTVTFLAISTGITYYNSYGYTAGQRLAPINSECNVTIPVPGDIVDNDCDGFIDEELRDGIDNDGDGRTDEDVAQYYDIDECGSSPCQNGDCVNLLDEYMCHCLAGFTGRNCDIDIDECSSDPCMHGGSCRDMDNSYVCTCKSGYVGNHCETDVDECASSPCINNATCVDRTPGWNCACLPGYSGKHCEEDIDECQSNPCKNRGTCVEYVDDFKCVCTNESTGQYCEQTLNHCNPSPCLHDGVCHNYFTGYSCECDEPWYGDVCEYKEFNRTEECTDLEYTECSCFTHRLKENKKSNKILSGSIGVCIGFALTFISYLIWRLLNKSLNKNRVTSTMLPQDSMIISDKTNEKTKKKEIKPLLNKSEKKPTENKVAHNCFIDHNGFDFSKVFVNKDGSKRIVKCRHIKQDKSSSVV